MNIGIGPIKRQFLHVEHCRDDMLLFPANIDPQVKLTASAAEPQFQSQVTDQVSVILEGGPSCQDDGGTITEILSTCAQKGGRGS